MKLSDVCLAVLLAAVGPASLPALAGPATPAADAAVPCDHPRNLVANCGFENGDPPTGWPGWGARSRDGSMPHSGSYSLRIESQIFGDDVPLAFADSNCFPVGPRVPHLFGVAVRVASTTTPVACGSIFLTYAAAGCSGAFLAEDSVGIVPSAPTGWVPVQKRVAASSGRISARLQLQCRGGDPGDAFTVHFDDAFAEIIEVVFVDGFE